MIVKAGRQNREAPTRRALRKGDRPGGHARQAARYGFLPGRMAPQPKPELTAAMTWRPKPRLGGRTGWSANSTTSAGRQLVAAGGPGAVKHRKHRWTRKPAIGTRHLMAQAQAVRERLMPTRPSSKSSTSWPTSRSRRHQGRRKRYPTIASTCARQRKGRRDLPARVRTSPIPSPLQAPQRPRDSSPLPHFAARSVPEPRALEGWLKR